MKLELTPYTASEAATATGRSVENQRNDRRAGYTPAHKGHARYNLKDLCRMFCIEQFARKGIGPRISSEFADEVAEKLFNQALMQVPVWSESAIGAPLDRIEKMALYTRVFELAEMAEPGTLSTRSATYGIIVWANGQYEIDSGIWERFEKLALYDNRSAGVVSVMLFASAARYLASQMPRPIYGIEGEVS